VASSDSAKPAIQSGGRGLTPLPKPIPPTYLDALAYEESAARQFNEIQIRISKQRSKFYDQLALLSGGAIVLSVSLLSMLFGKVVLHFVPVLIFGWVDFLIVLLACFLRSTEYQRYTMETFAGFYMKTAAETKIEQYQVAKQPGNKVMSSRDEEGETRLLTPSELKQQAEALFNDCRLRKKWADKHLRHTQIAERFADVTFWLGALCLIIFASVNILEATLSKRPDVLYIFL
jgi:hypothetical protein